MDYIEFEIDSTYATVSSLSGYSAKDAPSIALGRSLTNIVGAKIMEVNIPFSYYTITDQRGQYDEFQQNQFWIAYSVNTALRYQVTIPVGNYTATTLAAAIKAAIDLAILTPVGSPPLFTLPATSTVTFDNATGKFTIQVYAIGGVVSPLILLFSDDAPRAPLSQVFGADNSLSATPQITGPGVLTIWTLPYVAQVTGPNNLYVNSSSLGNICKAYIPESTLSEGETNPQMAMVPVNVNPGGVIWWQDPVPNEIFDTKNLFSLSRIDFYITAGINPVPLKFNGLGFQLKLILYIKNNEQGTSMSGSLGQNRSVLQVGPT